MKYRQVIYLLGKIMIFPPTILEPSLTQNSRGFIKYKYDDL